MGYIDELRKRVGSGPLIMVGAGVMLLDGQNRVLLQHRTDSHDWATPGGACELGESLEQTARRELLEETGLTIVQLRLFTVLSGPEYYYRYPNGDEVYNVSAMFVGRYAGEAIRPLPEETKDVQFFALDRLPPLMGPVNRRALELLKEALARGEL
ncbi:NUDIX hydrolase [uncultured Meiothermus sp.]|jgi:8-oxo-dGTP pyrophosphatase MutT (NUDIX family)|uniref:NUDIX hydrolase n=1 Tax=uncultured Meiothermus sp. TaxID=157471 RepID=UPI002634B571|nr:NUDIX hydrolase [uncultured Meiothermus sp.]